MKHLICEVDGGLVCGIRRHMRMIRAMMRGRAGCFTVRDCIVYL